MAGFIAVPNAYLNSAIYNKLNSKQVAIVQVLYSMTYTQPQEAIFGTEPVTLEPGQIITGLEHIHSKCPKDVSIRNIRTCLKLLEKLHFLASKVTNHGRLLTINEQYTYKKVVNVTDKQTDKQVTSNRQASDNYKEYKEDQESKSKEKIPRPKSDACPYDEIKNLWNHICSSGALPSIVSLSDRRKRIIRSGWLGANRDMDLIANAIKGALSDPFYLQKRYGIDTVFRHIDANVEKYTKTASSIKPFNPNDIDTKTREA